MLRKVLSACGLVLALVCVNCSIAAAMSRQLQQAVRLYEEGKLNDAMDRFLDVLTSGEASETAVANDYINAINLKLSSDEAVQSEAKKEPAAVSSPVSSAEGASAAPAAEEAGAQPSAPLLYAGDEAKPKPAAAAKKPVEEAEAGEGSAAALAGIAQGPDKNVIARKTERKIQAMREAAISRVKKLSGVKLYMDGDVPQAVGIDEAAIFGEKNVFRPGAAAALSEIAGLIFTVGKAGISILPKGAYSGDSKMLDMRRAMAVNSFFFQKGVASARLRVNFNAVAGKSVPYRLAEADGMLVLFEYDREPALKQPVVISASAPPDVTLGAYPSAVSPAKGEGLLLEFSVQETASPVSYWTLQISRYEADKTLSLVQEVSGSEPAYHQIYWNGRKNFDGEFLAAGKYLCVLSATDAAGKEKTARIVVSLEAAPAKAKAKPAEISGVAIAGRRPSSGISSVTIGKKTSAPARRNSYIMTFAKNSAVVTKTASAEIGWLAKAAKASPSAGISVMGYAASGEKNPAVLSKKRAKAVVRKLAAWGVDVSGIKTGFMTGQNARPIAEAKLTGES